MLHIVQVGLIEIDTNDKTEHSFRIQVLGRLYQLRANSRASCQDWVITLNRVKEARMQQGNVKLVGLLPVPTLTSTKGPAAIATKALDLLNPNTPSQKQQPQQQQTMHNDSENFMDGTPRVVVVSNRQRTHVVDEEEQWDQLIRIDDDISNNNNNNNTGTFYDADIDPATSQVETIYSGSSKRLSSIGTVVAARWTKHQSKMQRLGNKLSKWARSVKKYSCTDNDAVMVTSSGRPSHGDVVHLDKYLHPPGHDDKRHKQQQQQQVLSKMQSLSMPTTSHSTSHSSSTTAIPSRAASNTVTTSSALPMTTTTTSTTTTATTNTIITTNDNNNNIPIHKPLAIRDRTISSASDYDARMLS